MAILVSSITLHHAKDVITSSPFCQGILLADVRLLVFPPSFRIHTIVPFVSPRQEKSSAPWMAQLSVYVMKLRMAPGL